MLSNLRLRTKLAILVAVPLVAALAVALPGVRARARDLGAADEAQSLLGPAQSVRTVEQRVADEGSLSAWWIASGDPSVRQRLDGARLATDRSVRALRGAERDTAAAGARGAAARVHELRESAALIGQERQFVNARTTPDTAVLGYYRDLADDAIVALDAYARAPASASAALVFRDLAALARLDAALAEERSVLVVAAVRRDLTDDLAADLVAAVTRQNVATDALERQGRSATRAEVRRGTERFRATTDQVRRRRTSALTDRVLPASLTPAGWYTVSTAQIDAWRDVGDRVVDRAASDLARARDDARTALLVVVLGSAGVLLVALVVAWLVVRATTRPLRRLADTARDVASHQLPALVDTLQDPDAALPTVTPLAVSSRDELGALARAFNHVERTAVEVAERQREAVRTGISDLYVNLARRNQPLLERQLGLIEDLEREERDPDRLGAYFTLDHLATRMRRNSDSLLVLAGVAQDAGMRAPVPLLDVVRGAMSETSDFRRIDTAAIPSGVEVVGYAAADLAHLLSELLENATRFSPPGTRVVVVTHPGGTGLELTISDRGIGIPPERVEVLNRLLATPPPPGLVLSRALGLVVVARLARRIGVTVSLRSAPDVGTAAVVSLPRSVLRAAPRPEVDLVEAEAEAEDEAQARTGAGTGSDAAADAGVGGPSAPAVVAPPPGGPVATGPRTPGDMLPRRSRDHLGPRSGRPRGADGPPVEVPVVETPVEMPVEAPGDVVAEPERAVGAEEGTTPAGLPRRVPRPPEVPAAGATVDAPRVRPPDAVFELVARYEAGRRRARDAADGSAASPEDAPAIDEEEGT